MKSFSIAILALGSVVAGLGVATPDELRAIPVAATTASTPYVEPVVDFARNINKPCSAQEKSVFTLSVTIADGTDGNFVNGDRGLGVLMLKSGRPLIETDYPVPDSYFENDYYWFGGRKAKIDTTSPLNIVTFEGPGENLSVTLGEVTRDCVGQLARRSQ